LKTTTTTRPPPPTTTTTTTNQQPPTNNQQSTNNKQPTNNNQQHEQQEQQEQHKNKQTNKTKQNKSNNKQQQQQQQQSQSGEWSELPRDSLDPLGIRQWFVDVEFPAVYPWRQQMWNGHGRRGQATCHVARLKANHAEPKKQLQPGLLNLMLLIH
jgi:type IV secretory pathway VirB10-like protein